MDETPDRPMPADAPAPGAEGAHIDRGKLKHLLGYHLRRAEVLASQKFARAMDRFEISPPQLGVLLVVQANSGLNQTRVGRALGIDRSTLVSIIDTLEARGLVERTPSPTDRRSHALVMTAKGKSFIDELTPTLEAHEADLSDALSAEERDTLIDLLRRVVAAHEASG